MDMIPTISMPESPAMGVVLAAGGGSGIAGVLAAVLVLAIGSQWIAWRVKLPSILILLLTGFVAGPVVEWLVPGYGLDPDALFGDALTPAVGLAVGVILFEGGLTLKLREIRGVAHTVMLLVSVGSACTWVVAALAAWFVLGLSPALSILVGAILIVTGPTVIGPLLAHVKPKGQSGAILKWEGIVIDPIGVLMAVLVFEGIRFGQEGDAAGQIVLAIVRTILVGGGLGWAGALGLMWVIRRYWVPDFLQSPVALMVVVGLVAVSNMIQEESGLLTATLMGIVLANQRQIDVHKILEFKENLRVLLLSALFIVLSARLRLDELGTLNPFAILAYLVVLIVVARPLGVWLSTLGTGLSWREKLFMATMAPRGIVAAAAASLFALALEDVPEASSLVPIVFAVIVGTVTFYGIAASPVAKWLGVSNQNPQGVLFVGAVPWVRDVAKLLRARGIPVMLADTNRHNIRTARMADIPAEQIDVLGEHAFEELDLNGIGRVCAVTPNDEVNALVAQKSIREFGQAQVYQLPVRLPKPPTKTGTKTGPKTGTKTASSSGTASGSGADRKAATSSSASSANSSGSSSTNSSTKSGLMPGTATDSERQTTLVGRHLFSGECNYDAITKRLASGQVWKATTLTETFDYKRYRTLYGKDALVCFIIDSEGMLTIASADRESKYESGQTLISIVDPEALLMGSPF